MNWSRFLSSLAAIVVCVFGALPVAGQAAAPPDPALDPYVHPGLLADVGGGRKISLYCMGTGHPTVILTAGLGNWSEVWRKVQPAIAQRTRICAWDRAGYGFSSPSADPQDVLHTTGDLERALKAARIGGPYVLVGHSLGGYESLLFADRHPKDVVGMVLVDPSFPDQAKIAASFIGPEYDRIIATYNARTASYLSACENGLRAGTVKPGVDPTGCLAFPADYPPALQKALLPAMMDPAKYATMHSLSDNADADGALVINPHRRYGRRPIFVLTAGVAPTLPAQLGGSPAAVAGYAKYFAEGWPRGHQQIAALSSRGVHRIVDGSTHYIQVLRPDAVIEAIDEVLADSQ